MSMLTPRGVGARPGVRRRRGSWRVAVVVLAVLAIGASSWFAWSRSTSGEETRAAATPSCPAPNPTPTVVPAGQVRVNVYNATDRRGLAARVATELKRRGFRVAAVDNDPAKRTVTGAAEVRHGPSGADGARTVTAQVAPPGATTVVAVPDQRSDPSVDLVLGAAFTRLQAADLAAAALSPSPQPRPSGC